MQEYYFQMKGVAVGYRHTPLISDININIIRGEIVTMIGPNGAGKSTIIKSIIKQLALIGGDVVLDNQNMKAISFRDLSVKLAVVLTEHLRPEMMSCYDIVATGRYPYTGRMGILSAEDSEKVEEALAIVGAKAFAQKDFREISDGQRQRVLLARAICQEPEIILLDEPTSFLDVRHKIELLSILRGLAKEKGITVIMSLHEIDLAMKVSDKIMCVKGEHIAAFGTPEEIFKPEEMQRLYDIEKGHFDEMFGSVEMPSPEGDPRVLVISSGGAGIPIYRKLQKEGVAFAAGPLYRNDIDYQLAKVLAREVFVEEPFEMMSEKLCDEVCLFVEEKAEKVIYSQMKIGTMNQGIQNILETAKRRGILLEYPLH